MSVFITMLQNRRGEDGTLWAAGSSYFATDAFAQFLISSNLATGAMPAVPQSGISPAAGVAVNAVVSGDGAGLGSGSHVLVNRAGVLTCNGSAIREMGVCAYELLTNYQQGVNPNSFLTELPLIAQAGFRFVRVLGAPIYPNGWNATYGTDKAAFWAKTRAFLDCAAANRIGIIMSVFWRFATQADIVGETISTGYATAGSLTRTRCRLIATEFAQQFASHPALAAWEVGNEYSLFAANGSLPVASAGNGTPASYNNPADLLSLAAMRAFYTEFAQTIRAVDTTGRLILTGNGGSGGVIEKNIDNYKAIVALDNPDPVDSISIHKYSRNEFGSRAYADLTDTLLSMREVAAATGKPFVLGEFGMEEVETYGGYGGATTFQTGCDAVYRSGTQLALVWNWKQNNTTGANNFDIHPLNTTTGMNARIPILQAYHQRMRAEGHVAAVAAPAAPFVRGGQNIVQPAAATTALLLTAADNAALKPAGNFTVSLWVKPTRGDLTNRRIVRKYGSNAGWYVGIDASSPLRTVFMQVQYSDGTTQNLGGQALGINVDEWRHYTFVFNSAAGQATSGLTLFENGRWIKTLALPGGKTWNASTDSLLFFADAGPASPFYGAVRDVRLMNRALTDVECRDLYLYDVEPAGVYTTTGGKWPFNGALTDASGNGNTPALTSGAVVYETFTK